MDADGAPSCTVAAGALLPVALAELLGFAVGVAEAFRPGTLALGVGSGFADAALAPGVATDAEGLALAAPAVVPGWGVPAGEVVAARADGCSEATVGAG